MNQLKKNINRNYLFVFISRFDLTNGIWMLYLAFKGLSLFEIGLMETVYHLSSFSMEIPTGAIADIYGRKTSRVLGRIASVISVVIMILGNNVVAFAISFFFTALSNNLESGAGDALIYDSMKEIGVENKYMKVAGRNELFYQITKTVSLLVGGYVATISYEYVYQLALVVTAVSVIQSLSFKEPNIGKVEKVGNLFQTFINQIKTSFKAMHEDKHLIEMIIALEVFSTFYTTIFFYLQNLLKSSGRTEFEIGVILAIGALTAAVFATQTYRIEKKFSLKNILKAIALLSIPAFWGMTYSATVIPAFILLAGIEGVFFVSMSDFVNKRIESDKRATILSFQSMIFSVFMIILFPVVGFLGDKFGLQNAFIAIALTSTIVMSLFYTVVKKR